jgi:hypothetical protein
MACCTVPALPTICTLKVPRGVLALVDNVSSDVAPLLPGIALDGEKLQAAAFGNPEQDSATAELTAPPTGVKLTLNLTDCPCFTVALLGLATIEKSVPTPLRLTLGVFVAIPSEPLTVSAPTRVPVDVGVNVTLKTQEAPPRNPAVEQLFTWEKSPVVVTPES